MKKLSLLIFFFLVGNFVFGQSAIIHQVLNLDFEIESLSEKSPENPFTDYRLQVEFKNGESTFSVPGYFAADGKSAESSASEGRIWRVNFTPNQVGNWTYTVSFKKGKNIAVDDDAYTGVAVAPHDGKAGVIQVMAVSAGAKGFEKSGRLIYNNSRYLYTEDGKPFLKFGTNSPENFLSYNKFDATYPYDPNKSFPKTWEPHVKDWKVGDPTWQGDKGKGIIGALNYLASKGMNCVYALTLNIEGDARDVWPFISHEKKDFLRYDVSKLAQWDIVISHAEKLGIVMNLVTQEKENELILDDGYTGLERKLYYRELIARFGHHKNIIWNMGEENGQVEFWPQGQNDQQRFSMIRYLKDHDPYKNVLVIHTMSEEDHRVHILEGLLAFDRLDGLSMQVGNVYNIHDDFKNWGKRSASKGRPWIMMMDEIGPWHTGTRTDADDPKHDTLRHEVLWGTLMAGGAGVEWYFGWLMSPHDLNAEDWRSRNNMWEQSAVAHEFFKQIPFAEMSTADQLITNPKDYCFAKDGEVYAIYLKHGGTTSLNLSKQKGKFDIKWYNPRTGGKMLIGSKKELTGGDLENIGTPPSDMTQDWAILITKK